MTDLATGEVTMDDRIRLDLTFDAERMFEEVREMQLADFLYYDVLPLRSPAHLVDTSLAPPPPATDYADGSWTPWLDTPALTSSPYLTSVVDFFRAHCSVTLVRLLRLAAGAVVDEHTDPTLALEVPQSVIRLTVPIKTEEAVRFYLNGTVVPMKAGECWYLRLTDPHRITHGGSEERVNLTIDMVPNDWVRSLLRRQVG